MTFVYSVDVIDTLSEGNCKLQTIILFVGRQICQKKVEHDEGCAYNSSFLNQRRHEEAPEDSICKRDAFQRDRDRIMHSRAFRRMMHKTQIFNANMGGDYPEFCVPTKRGVK